MQKRNAKRRLAGAAGALALSLTGVAATSGAAFAAELGPNDPGHPAEGSLTVIKHEGAVGDAGDGTEQTIDQPVLGGVQFTLWQVGVVEGGDCTALNLTDPEAWDEVPTSGYPTALPESTADGDLCALDADNGDVRITDAEGKITFDGLDLGLYYVEETDATGAYKKVDGENVPVNVTGEAAPFYVTIPMPNNGDWIYDVYVYPKNQVTDGPSKTINTDEEQVGYTVGDSVSYTITQTVPALKADEDHYTAAAIWETFSDGMKFGATGSVQVNGADVGYTQTPANPVPDNTKNVSWALDTDALADLKEGDVITVTFTGVVTAVTTSGSIENPMSEDPKDPGYGSEFNGEKTPKPPVEPPNPITYWGQLKVNKVDQDGDALAGAEFAVGMPNTDGTCPADAPAPAVATGAADTNGVVQWEGHGSPLGLWITNTNDELVPNPAGKSRVFCLYETKAPAGYAAVTDPLDVTITAGSATPVEIDVENTQNDGPDLPLTGASGTMLMTIGGIGLLAVAGGGYLAMRRRQVPKA